MKKKTLVLLALLLGTVTNIWSQTNADTVPVFDQNPSIVLDLWNNRARGKYKDYIKFTNATLHQNISFNIYGYDQINNQWIIIGSAHLKRHCDIDTVISPYRGRMNEFRWLAVHSLDGMEFDAQIMVYRNDIYVTILKNIPTGIGTSNPQSNDNAPVFDIQFSIVLDLWENKSKYNDYVKLTNATLHQNISFNIYGYDQRNNQWIIIGPAHLKKVGDVDTITSPWRGRMNEFRWLAVHSLNSISFNASAVTNRNDIMIIVR